MPVGTVTAPASSAQEHQRSAYSLDEPPLGKERRIDPVRELAQLLERGVDLHGELGEDRVRALGIGGGELAGNLDVDGETEQVLLSAVVQVALDPPPFGVGRGDDART